MLKRSPIARRTPVKARRSKPRRGRVRDFAYLAFIGYQPCFLCVMLGLKQTSPTEVAHVGTRGLSQKSSDRETLPMCGDTHHQHGPESQHVLGKSFWAHHGVERDGLLAHYQAKFAKFGFQEAV